ncbi:NAD(P)H-hydrate dehydratase [Natrononativus amylolyticus]|uniref:NAD(P)H-hydrate dehydratase n=1 Tax=Natrononativus amylolyticus TaxID=2963434 RepID=UPI0020CB9194|nr:NAD(P)H-hydrate dehydratase [Natrononativus amylolyticus]
MTRFQRTLSEVAGASSGDSGRVGVVGGGVDYPGQPAIVGLAALRTGSDDVRVMVTEEIYPIVAGFSPNLLVSRYAGTRFEEAAADGTIERAADLDALVLGPGLADADPTAIQRTISAVEIPVVIDALAIEPGVEADLSNAVLTPNSEERDELVDAYGSLEAFSRETDAVVVFTGSEDEIVADGERTVNETGTEALTVAGTGDTLAGIVASLLGQGMERETATEIGAWTLGKAGELATAERGPGVVATDVIDRIPDTIR